MLGVAPPKSGKLPPVQVKKSLRPQSQKFAIDCNIKDKIFSFLTSIHMEKYYNNFIANGIDNEEKLSYLNNGHLKMVGIPYAHRIVILKKIKEKNNPEPDDPNASRFTTTQYEEIVAPAEDDEENLDKDYEEQRRTFTQALLEFKQTHNERYEEEYNEEEKSEFNNLKNVDKKEICVGDDEDINKDLEDNSNKENDNNNSELVEIGEYTESISPDRDGKIDLTQNSTITARQFLPLHKQKTLCYQCLRMLLQEHCIKKYDKPFCSLHCVDVYESKNIVQCAKCNKKIEKGSSISIPPKYYCNANCVPAPAAQPQSSVSGANNPHSTLSSDSDQIIDILDI